MRNKNLRELIALSLIENLGARRIKWLLQSFDHPQSIFRTSRKELGSVAGIGPATVDSIRKFNQWKRVDQIIEASEKMGVKLLTLADDAYPERLKQIYDPPILLWVMGDIKVLKHDGLAVVGTRRPSRYGISKTEFFTGKLVQEGLAIISGLAYGIDTEAHRTALKYGGKTIAVLGSGIDWIYPAKNRGLAKKIANGRGAVISEFPLGTKPEAGNFPVRNRVVSGLSLGTLMVESGDEGGSLITVKSALDQNREVFIVPHSLDNPTGMGCNTAIKKGEGKLIQYAEDILEEIPEYKRVTREEQTSLHTARWKQQNLNRTAKAICTLLERGEKHIDELSEKLDKNIPALLAELSKLEMKGCVMQKSGKIFRLK